jgi:zinc transporter, ZIP family
VSSGQVLVLGALAGLTIFLGLPTARLRRPAPGLKAFLNAGAIGILLFLLWDVLSNAIDPVTLAMQAAQDGRGSWLRFAGLSAAFGGCLAVGLLTLVYFDRWRFSRPPSAPPPPSPPFGPGAAAVEEFRALPSAHRFLVTPAHRLAFLIALGIGLHNFSEGLAIGQSAAKGNVSLALLLIIGFGLHNGTEGFGICGPLAAAGERPTWGFLLVVGLIGGGPTFVGTLIGQSFVNNVLSLAFLALAAGSILYVVVQLVFVAQKLGFKELLMWGLLTGLLVGFATDLILKAAGT